MKKRLAISILTILLILLSIYFGFYVYLMAIICMAFFLTLGLAVLISAIFGTIDWIKYGELDHGT